MRQRGPPQESNWPGCGAGDPEARSYAGCGAAGLAAADPQIDDARDGAPHALRIDDAEIAIAQREAHAPSLSPRQMDSLEADERAERRARDAGAAGVELHHLVAIHRANIGDVHRRGQRAAGGHLRAGKDRRAIAEAGEREAVTEAVQRRAVEIAI